MPERYTELDVPFSTADTEGKAEITFRDFRLAVVFKDWRNVVTRVVFEEVAAFRWDDNYLCTCDVAPDRVYQIEESSWMAALRDAGRLGSPERHVHYRLYFISEASALDVIATSMKPEPIQSTTDNSGAAPLRV